MIACLKEEKKTLADQIQQFMAKQEAWQEPTEILGSAPGVGMVTTATLLADLPELGKMDGKKTLAPHAHLPDLSQRDKSRAVPECRCCSLGGCGTH